MPRGRQPRSKAQQADNAPAILRTVRLGDDLYGEGEEEELLEALKEFEERDKEARKADKTMTGKPFSADEEVHRLTRLGHLANFVELSEEEIEHMDPDLRANAQYARQAKAAHEKGEVVETVPGRPMVAGVGRQPRARPRAVPVGEEENPEALKPRGARRRARRGPLQEEGETAEDPAE